MSSTARDDQGTASVSEAGSAYDAVPYDGHAFGQSHPRRLATIATILGLSPAPIAGARVLELGCASGANLLPMAAAFPDARFVGIELSRVQVDAARAAIAEYGLTNVEIVHESIDRYAPEPEGFDYVIAHGVFSWVPRAIQEAILATAARALGPQGVAYVSYNTLPGWRSKQIARDLMLFHAAHIDDPELRARAAREALGFVAKSASGGRGYAALLESEVKGLEGKADAYLLHDHLEVVNDPILFSELAARAEAHGLRYLGEATLSTIWPGNLSNTVQERLRTWTHDRIRTEQYVDFLRNRPFRQTLLSRAEPVVSDTPPRATLARLHVASAARPHEGGKPITIDPRKPGEVLFAAGDLRLTTRDATMKAALLHLGEVWPRAVPFEELLAVARARGGADEPEEEAATRLGRRLVRAAFSILDLHLDPPRFASAPGPRPEAWWFSRRQAARGPNVTSLRHADLALRDVDRALVLEADGTKTHDDLAAALSSRVSRGELRLADESGSEVRDPARVAPLARRAVDERLRRLARFALLVS